MRKALLGIFCALCVGARAQEIVGLESCMAIRDGKALPESESRALADQVFSLADRRGGELGVRFYPDDPKAAYAIALSIALEARSKVAVAKLFAKGREDDEIERRAIVFSDEGELLTRLPGVLVALWAKARGKTAGGQAPVAVSAIDFNLFNEYFGVHSAAVPLDIAFGGSGSIYLPIMDRCIVLDPAFRLKSVINPEKLPPNTYLFRAAVNPSGALFLSSSGNGDVFRLMPGGTAAELIPGGSQPHLRIAAFPDGALLADDIAGQSFLRFRGRKAEPFSSGSTPAFSFYFSVDREGILRVVDAASQSMLVYGPDGRSLGDLPFILPGIQDFYPQHIGALSGGDFVLADSQRLAGFDRNGLMRWYLPKVSDPGSPDESLSINAMAVDPDSSSIYLLDYMRRKVVRLVDRDFASTQDGFSANDAEAVRLSLGIAAAPDLPDAYLALAASMKKRGEHEAAYSLYHRAAELFPVSRIASEEATRYKLEMQKARTLRLSGECLDLAARVGPESARQKYTEAAAAFESYLFLAPGDVDMAARKRAFQESYLKLSDPAKRDRPKLEFLYARSENLIPAYSQLYALKPPLKAGIRNSSQETVSKLTAQAFISGFMAYPEEIALRETLKPGEEIQFSMPLRLDRAALALEEDMGVQVLLSLSYESRGELFTVAKAFPLTIYRKTSIDWSDSKSLAAFITPNDSLVNGFASAVLSSETQAGAFGKGFARAYKLLSALGAYGIAYVEDPEAGVSEALGKKEILDTVRFPRTTLMNRTGDCDDHTALAASLLESAGIATAILTGQGHVYLAFAPGDGPSMSWMYETKKTAAISYQGKLWIPVETTLLASGFKEAWEKGSALWRGSEESRGISSVDSARNEYPPVSLAESSLDPPVVQAARLESAIGSASDWLVLGFAREIETTLTADAEGKDVQKREKALNRLAILYANTGRGGKAEACLEKALAANPLSLQSIANLYGVKLGLGKEDEAGRLLAGGLEKKPDSAILNRLYGEYLERSGQAGNAIDYLRKGGVKLSGDGTGQQRAGLGDAQWFPDRTE